MRRMSRAVAAGAVRRSHDHDDEHVDLDVHDAAADDHDDAAHDHDHPTASADDEHDGRAGDHDDRGTAPGA
jgi:hypothetical protein